MKKHLSKYTPRGYKLSVRRSLTGKGLFTKEDIPKGVCVIEYTGRVVSSKEADEDEGRYLFEVNSRKTIDGNVRANRARYINHSCRPNCEAIGPGDRIFIFSRKRIKAGTELTYDYGKEYFDKFIKPKGCKCEKHRANK
ncbi:MAG TPA: SET domain-containing protein [Candidatus Paceibacterota bacterium]|nr:SET domain-containing protein [Candidatus Paceibacterota bacterium]